MSLQVRLSSYWCAFQEYLFPTIEADLGPLGERYQLFITVLELVRVEQHLRTAHVPLQVVGHRALRCLCGMHNRHMRPYPISTPVVDRTHLQIHRLHQTQRQGIYCGTHAVVS